MSTCHGRVSIPMINATVVDKCDVSDTTQHWIIESTAFGGNHAATTVKHMASGLCLSFQGVATHSNIDIGLMQCDQATKWMYNHSGLRELAAVVASGQPKSLNGMCLDVTGGTGPTVDLWACHASDAKDVQNQQWNLLLSPGQPSTVTFRSGGVGGGCLTVGQVPNSSGVNPGCNDVVGWLDQRAWGTTLAVEALHRESTLPQHPLLALATAELEALIPQRPQPADGQHGMQVVPKDQWDNALVVCDGAADVAFDGSGAISLLTTHAKGLSFADKQHLLAEPVVHVSSQKQRIAWSRACKLATTVTPDYLHTFLIPSGNHVLKKCHSLQI